MVISRPRGTNDFLPDVTSKWQKLEAMLRELCRQYGYKEIRTPLFEGWKINGNGNGEVFNRRAKSFCETVLLWTVNSLYEIMAVFAVSGQSTKSSKLG